MRKVFGRRLRGSTATDYKAVDENDEIHRIMMDLQPELKSLFSDNDTETNDLSSGTS